MLLTDARRPARTGPDGGLVPLAEQDRTRWDRSLIAEGLAVLTDALRRTPIGRYQLQAAIAAVHDEAATVEDTDWPQILGLYDLLRELDPAPMVRLNRIVALAMVHGPRAGLAALDGAALDGAALDGAALDGAGLAGHHRLHAVRAHLLDLAGEHDAACDEYRLAAAGTRSGPERRYLESRAGTPSSDGLRSRQLPADAGQPPRSGG
jgi:predicted RNA polymerase sigma factor